jgi:hypothetical protein
VPDRIILTWAGDPATSMSVNWRTDTSVERGSAQIAPAADGPDFATNEVQANTAPFRADLGEWHNHTARFTNLKPDTVYMYRVGGGGAWSEWLQFRTASDKEAPLTFLYSGDAQNGILSHWSRVIREGFRQAPDARFILHSGDLVHRGKEDKYWGEWFRAGGWINAMIPSLPAPGNHEYDGGKVTPHWRAQFDLPENGPAGLEETCYYVDIQGVRMIALNSTERQQEQAAWLEKVLSDNPHRWTIAYFHHPLFSTAKSRDNQALRDLWQPIFDKYGVDLVLQGHDHAYGRSDVVTSLKTEPGRSGTVYVVSVGGSKMYGLNGEDWMKKSARDTQLIQIIRIDGDRLSFEARTPSGRLFDSFQLQKRNGMANILVDPVQVAAAPAPAVAAASAPAAAAAGAH